MFYASEREQAQKKTIRRRRCLPIELREKRKRMIEREQLDLRSALAELGLDSSTSTSTSEPSQPLLDAATIRAAFRRRAKEIHPDLNPGARAEEEASRRFARLSRAAEVALAAASGRGSHYSSQFQHQGVPESLLSSLLRQRKVALGLSAALVAAGGGALWLALGVHRDRYSKEVAAVVRQPPSEAALSVARMVEEARVEARDLRLKAEAEAEKKKGRK